MFVRVCGIFLVCCISIELFLRFVLGFCDAVLVRDDRDYEYIPQPNQHRVRYGNHIIYNAYSMRSDRIQPKSIKILGFGDSILNGGAPTDQKKLASSIISNVLSEKYGIPIQFLNISYGSWGPDNCFAYLKKHGDFDAKCIVLVVSSHDAYDNMTFKRAVDVPGQKYRSTQYSFAIHELLHRYLDIDIFFQQEIDESELLINKKSSINYAFNTGFKDFVAYAKQHNIPFIIYLHADEQELHDGEYNVQGQEILAFAKTYNIPVIQDLKQNLRDEHFRDIIHINTKGQQHLAQNILDYLQKHSIIENVMSF